MACPETLYLKATERHELTHKLSQRAASALRSLGEQPSKVYRELSQAYDIRSTYVHGSAIEADKRESAPALLEAVLKYARKSLVAFLQLADSGGKDSFLTTIDNGFLEDGARQKMDEKLKPLVKSRE